MTVLENFAQVLCAETDSAAALGAGVPERLLDALGAMIAAGGVEEGRALGSAGFLGPLEDTLLDRVARAVALVRLTEVDDIHLAACVTPAAVAAPVALLFANRLRKTALETSAAIFAAYDAMVRMGEAVDGPRILYRGVWPTFLVAPLGAAAAAGRLIGLDERAMSHALAIALAQMSGAPGRGEGKSSRWLLVGLAARAGCAAALAARDGFCGDLGLLDGDWLERTHGLRLSTQSLEAARPGEALRETSQKPYCCARQTLAASQAMRQALSEGLDPSALKDIRVLTPTAYADMVRQAPTTRSGRIVGIAYQIALAAARPADLFDLARPPLEDPALAALIGKIRVAADPSLDALFPALWPARVEFGLLDGSVRQVEIRVCKGDPQDPLSRDELEKKFMTLVAPIEGPARAADLASATLGVLDRESGFAVLCAEFDARARAAP